MSEVRLNGEDASPVRGEAAPTGLTLEPMSVETVGQALAFCNIEGKKNCARGNTLHATLTWLNRNRNSKEAERWKGKISIFNASYKDEIGRAVYEGIVFMAGEFLPVKHTLGDAWTQNHHLVVLPE